MDLHEIDRHKVKANKTKRNIITAITSWSINWLNILHIPKCIDNFAIKLETSLAIHSLGILKLKYG